MEDNKKGPSLSDLSEGAIPTATPTTSELPTKLPKLNASSVKEANISEVVQPNKSQQVQTQMGNPMIDSAFESLDGAIERTRQEYAEIEKKGEEQRIEEKFDNDEDINIISNNQNIELVESKFNKPVVADDDVSFEDDEEEDISFLDNNMKVEDKYMDQNQTPEITTPIVEESIKTNETKNETTSLEVEKLNHNNKLSSPSVYRPETVNAAVTDDDMKLLDDEEDDDDEEDKKRVTEEIKEKIRVEIKENFNPVSNKIDLGKFKIAKKPVNASKVIAHIQQASIEAADGVLYAANRPVRMSALSAMEIESLDKGNIKRGNYNQFMLTKLHLIYDHLIDTNKPHTFETWMKSVTNDVVDDYFFTLYKATFGKSNIVTYSCQDDECHNIFMKSRDIDDMIKFKNNEVKTKYLDILHSGNINTETTEYETKPYQANNEYVFSLRKPSLYATYIEPSLINEEFINKYEDLLLLISYIDDIYVIDSANEQLIKIDTKADPRRPDVTVKRKIKTYATIIKSLTSDQLQSLSIATDELDDAETDDSGNLVRNITYIYPEDTCEKCGKTIPEAEESPENMLFTRHQLGLMSKI